ncbi:PEP-CTERM sorting domain-containing protein [Nitrosomonas marina]|uniref:PEP-CTERM protein-sorting domain-containing protein n=1 Tax=Nitrosomonas marina TaxID=917 RepID=A0A1H8BS75_9PROT|nr:PEP-CTERM sorting domain-containing protein [Nitrosomonas marina]SEM84858.1 PEP-CTERM protein-sorting domain-containing protein [Nitrosomonas marina]
MSKKMTRTLLSAAIASGMIFCTVSGAYAGLIGVKEIKVFSANLNTTDAWLQVSEVEANQTGGGDAALSSLGATAAGSVYTTTPGSSPDFAIDGIAPQGFPNIFHSATFAPTEALTVTLASATELDSISIYGRDDNFGLFRDIYNVELYDMSGALLHTVFGLDARNNNHVGSAVLPDTSVPPVGIAEPGTLALLGLGLAGISFRRRQK